MANRASYAILDQHVRNAQRSGKFTDGTKISYKGDNEHGFIVQNNGIFEVQVKKQKIFKCKDGREIITTYFNINAFMGHAGGHTHPKGAESYPGPRDGDFAKALFKKGTISYLISPKAAYAVEWDGNRYLIRNLTSKGVSERKKAKIIKQWMKQKPKGKGLSDRDFVCD